VEFAHFLNTSLLEIPYIKNNEGNFQKESKGGDDKDKRFIRKRAISNRIKRKRRLN